jgi:hypothetical protein
MAHCKRCNTGFEIKKNCCLSLRVSNDGKIKYCRIDVWCPFCDARYVKILEGEDLKQELIKLGLW